VGVGAVAEDLSVRNGRFRFWTDFGWTDLGLDVLRHLRARDRPVGLYRLTLLPAEMGPALAH
jgi:hypothetical protein